MKTQKRKNSGGISISAADHMQTAVYYMNKLIQLIVCIYMILIIVVMPFYFTQGYGRIGSDKYDFFYKVTTTTGKVFLPVLGLYLLLMLFAAIFAGRQARTMIKDRYRRGNSQPEQEWLTIIQRMKLQLSVTDWFALLYGIALILSYLHSDYREMTPYGDAWKGANNWSMGFVTQIMFLGIYFTVSRLWKPKKWLIALVLPVTAVVYFLGYCNRFSVYPFEMANWQPAFISTIGNINWYCGYVVTVFFGVMYYWWSGAENRKWLKWPFLIYSLLGFGTLVTQGSSSGLMTLAAVMFVMYLMSASDGEKMQHFWLMALLLGIACTVSMLLRYFFPERVVYSDGLTDLLTTTAIPLGILLLTLVMYIVVRMLNQKNRYPVKLFTIVGKIAAVAGILLAVLLVVGIVANTLNPGCLGKLSELGVFTFDEYWGSRRGATYWAGFQTWLDQDMTGKLVGVGPDSMSMYIHMGENPAMREMVARLWGNARLTNAHNEWITMLANVGVIGAAGYIGMIVSFIARNIKAGRKISIVGASGICILAYTINNMVSFQQAMSTSVMFLILGIGEAFIRREAAWQEKYNKKNQKVKVA